MITDPSHYPLCYTDRLIGIASWPKVQTTYMYGGTAINPVLALTLLLDCSAYLEQQGIADDLAMYQQIYCQLNQDHTGLDEPRLGGKAVTMTLFNSLLAEPANALDDTQSQVIRDFVAACTIFLQTLANGGIGTVPSAILSLPLTVIASNNCIALEVSLTFTRQVGLVDSMVASVTDDIAVTSAILPEADVGVEASSYTQFAAALETVLQTDDWFMRAASGLTQAGDNESKQTPKFFAVRFGRSVGKGIYFQIADQAGYYAPLPIAKSPESRTVMINVYRTDEEVTLSFTGIDPNLWFESCLNAVDKFLSPTYALPTYILDNINHLTDPLKEGELALVLAAKQNLADKISATVSPILNTSADDTSTLRIAAETLRRQLLIALEPAFAAGTIVVYGLEQVSGADGIYPVGPPSFYGQPVIADGAKADNNQSYTLFPACIPLATAVDGTEPRLAFSFVSENLAYMPLDMTCQITHMEFERAEVPGIRNNGENQCLGFINGPLVYPLGNETQYIPLMNRVMPVSPMVVNQIAIPSAQKPADQITPAQLALWNYGFTYTYQQAAQDAVNITIALNVSTAPQWLEAQQGMDLFTALAAFVTNYPTISADLDDYLIKIDGQTNDPETLKKATQATHAFQQLVTQVATGYAEQFAESKTAAANQDDSVPVSFDARLEDDGNGYARYSLLNVTISGITATYQSADGTISNGSITLSAPIINILPDQYQATSIVPPPQGALLAYRYQAIPPSKEPPLSFESALANTELTVSMPGLNGMMHKNAQASVFVQRNKYLFPLFQTGTVSTMPSFLYQTPVVKFPCPVLPSISWPSYSLRQVQPVGGKDVNAYMQGFFNALFAGASGQLKLVMEGSYSYNVDPSLATLSRSSLPISLLPSSEVVIDPMQPPASAMALTKKVDGWYQDNQPPTAGKASMDFQLNFLSDDSPEQSLLRIERLFWNVDG